MPLRQKRIRGGGTQRGAHSGEEPVAVGAVERRPLRRPLDGRRKVDVAPTGSQRHQEGAVHHAFEISGKGHPHVREAPFLRAGHQPEQEQEHAVPHQPPTRCRPILIGGHLLPA